MAAPKLHRVMRLDSTPLNKAYYTPEGYLRDNPILTTTGIFEYHNSDGSVRRELRLPDEVFAAESLASYKGKPIIITHDAGLIDKDNVNEESIGTILSEGVEDGENVRAQIVIHDTDSMKDCSLKELSLGYSLDLEETPGIWNGMPYDAIQRNIYINHLALVREARAGDNARLNIDSRDKKILKGGAVSMKKTNKKHSNNAKRSDGVLSQEDFALAIEKYKARRAERMAAKADDDDEEVVATEPAIETTGDAITSEDIANAESVEEKVELLKDRRDRRDAEGDPETVEEAVGVIANQDEDIEMLYDIIDTLLAEKEVAAALDGGEAEEVPAEDGEDDEEGADVTATDEGEEGDETVAEDEGEEGDETAAEDDDEETVAEDDDDEDETVAKAADCGSINADSVDRMVSQKIEVGMFGRTLNMDGLESMPLMKAKKKIIARVCPDLRLDGKSAAYVEGAYQSALKAVKKMSKKGTSYQKKQMFNKDSRSASKPTGSDAARQRMIDRQFGQK